MDKGKHAGRQVPHGDQPTMHVIKHAAAGWLQAVVSERTWGGLAVPCLAGGQPQPANAFGVCILIIIPLSASSGSARAAPAAAARLRAAAPLLLLPLRLLLLLWLLRAGRRLRVPLPHRLLLRRQLLRLLQVALPRLLPWLLLLRGRVLPGLLLPLLQPIRLPLRLQLPLLLLPRLPVRLVLLLFLLRRRLELGRGRSRRRSCRRRCGGVTAIVAAQRVPLQLPAGGSSRCLGWRLRLLAAAHGALRGGPLRLLPARGPSGTNHLLALLLQQRVNRAALGEGWRRRRRQRQAAVPTGHACGMQESRRSDKDWLRPMGSSWQQQERVRALPGGMRAATGKVRTLNARCCVHFCFRCCFRDCTGPTPSGMARLSTRPSSSSAIAMPAPVSITRDVRQGWLMPDETSLEGANAAVQHSRALPAERQWRKIVFLQLLGVWPVSQTELHTSVVSPQLPAHLPAALDDSQQPGAQPQPPAPVAPQQQSAAMSQFGTPLFAEKDLCIFLSELGMSANAEQLGKPTFEFVQPIYENLVTALTGVTRCAPRGGAARPQQLCGRRRRPPACRTTAAATSCPPAAGRSCSSPSLWPSTPWSSPSCTTSPSQPWPSSATSPGCCRPPACATGPSRRVLAASCVQLPPPLLAWL